MSANRQGEIALIAYELFEKRGYIGGREFEDWCEAERIVAAKYITIEALTAGILKPAEDDAKPKTSSPENSSAEKKPAAAKKTSSKTAAPKTPGPKLT
ncbi:MAG TPA: DUF2934 domain-containing protein [Dissulfurispiraceae bacterium]|nr:DUF2934 domain-containing protein [Dissulfurispiraceae bacterium]